MAKVSDIIFCSEGFKEENRINARNIMAVMQPEYIPGLLSFSVIISIQDIDKTAENLIKVTFNTPDDRTIASMNGKIPCSTYNSNLPEQYQGVNAVISWENVEFGRSGLYKILIYLNEQLLATKEIYVKEKKEAIKA